jgi:cobalt-zinc-cadmium efflux system protein
MITRSCPQAGRRRHNRSRLLITLVINLLIPAAQIVGGIYAHSMALISDAVHNFSDFTALLIAYFAYRIGKKGASPQNTFGYKVPKFLEP